MINTEGCRPAGYACASVHRQVTLMHMSVCHSNTVAPLFLLAADAVTPEKALQPALEPASPPPKVETGQSSPIWQGKAPPALPAKGFKLTSALACVGIGLAVRALMPASVDPQAWTLLSIFTCTVSGAASRRGGFLCQWPSHQELHAACAFLVRCQACLLFSLPHSHCPQCLDPCLRAQV